MRVGDDGMTLHPPVLSLHVTFSRTIHVRVFCSEVICGPAGACVIFQLFSCVMGVGIVFKSFFL